MKSESRVKGYKPGTEDWKAEYNMLLDDGLTCNDCTFVKKCCALFGQAPYVNEGKCQFYPNRFVLAKDEELYRIFSEIDKECKRQDEKWGEQNHSMVNQFITPEICGHKADFFKKVNKDKKYFRSWFTILLEEVYETFAETEPEKQYREIIQTAAVAIQIAKHLKRTGT